MGQVLAKIYGEVSKPNNTLRLSVLFGSWYFQNIIYNIYMKKLQNTFPFPWLLSSFHLFSGSVWMLAVWFLKLQPCPKLTKPFIVSLLGPALFHTVGHLTACLSSSKNGNFIKSAEPVFSLVFSYFLGNKYPLRVWLSILPIVFGCVVAPMSDGLSLDVGFSWGALITNVAFVLRNIYSKKSLQGFKEVSGLNLYGCISIISFMYTFPVAVLVEGSKWVQGYQDAIEDYDDEGNEKPKKFYTWVLIMSVIFYQLYNQSSYQALDGISPLTFSVGNTMKRVVVIITAILVFNIPVKQMNALGCAVAILGTLLYSQAKKKNGDGKKS